jgi:hypothetical protein
MPNKALSERIKEQKQSRFKEETLQKAIDAYQREQTSETGCSKLKANGACTKDLPAKPKCLSKPKPMLEANAHSGEPEEQSSSNSE